MRKSKLKKLFTIPLAYLAILIYLIISISACATSGRDAIEPPKYMPWDYLTKFNRETPGYALYTYVLFNRKTFILEETYPDVAEKYRALLKAIEELPIQRKYSTVNAGESNIFYIPSIIKKDDRALSFDNYNTNLSFTYISEFVSVIKTDYEFAQQFVTGTGPFLISIFSPLQHLKNTSKIYKNHFPLLFIDLSKSTPSSIKDIVKAYQTIVIHSPEMEAKILDSFRSTIIDLYPNLNDKVMVLDASTE